MTWQSSTDITHVFQYKTFHNMYETLPDVSEETLMMNEEDFDL